MHRRPNLLLVLALSLSPFCVAADSPAAGSEQPAMAIRDLDTPRDFPKIADLGEWRKRARAIREQILVSSGLWPLPEKTPLRATIFGKVVRDGYSVEKVYFQTWPGFYLAGNLYRPVGRGDGPFPAILNPDGHWENGRLADTKDGSIPGRCINFAKQGMIAFSYDMVGYNDTRFADSPTGPDAYKSHRHFATNDNANLLWNINLMGLQTWDSIRALDFLESLPDADKSRLACTGESGGGTQTFMLGAVDDRLAAQAPVVMVSHTMQGGCGCENMPGLRVQFSNMEIAAAAAPRPQIMVAATGDWTKTMMEVEGPAVADIYRLVGAPEKLRYVRFDFGHNYNQTSREAVYQSFGEWLLHQPDATGIKESLYAKEPDNELLVWPDGKLPADALTEKQLIAAMKARAQDQLKALQPGDEDQLRNYKEVMLPAWKRTLQIDVQGELVSKPLPLNSVGAANYEKVAFGYGSEENRINGTLFKPRLASEPKAPAPIVICVSSSGPSDFCDADGTPTGLAKQVVDHGFFALVPDIRSSAKIPDQFIKFYTTYNRTELQQRVGEVVTACDCAKVGGKYSRVILCGTGRAGLWAILAAPAADAVITDTDGVDIMSDESLLAPDLFCPGLRKIGAFEGVATLAIPHPLLLHNVGAKFPTTALQSAYAAAQAGNRLRVDASRLDNETLAQWISNLK